MTAALTGPATVQALEEAVAEVLETMFFAESDPQADFEMNDAEVLAARVEFRGDRTARPGDTSARPGVALTAAGKPSGSFAVAVSASAARRLAADFLGMESGELRRAEAGQVVREMANMICGAVLSKLAHNGSFDLDAPESAGGPRPSWFASGVRTRFDLGDGTLCVCLDWSIPAV